MSLHIEYRTDIVEGQRHFACVRLHATLSTASCADRFARASTAQDWREGRFAICARCLVGQLHASQQLHANDQAAAAMPELPDLAAKACVRCGRGELRLIPLSGLCVSCHNRQAEARKGRNARGKFPVTFQPATPRRVGIVEADGRHTWRVFEGVTNEEAIARAVRAGHRTHGRAPGRATWHADLQQFVYRDDDCRTLLGIEVDGVIEFIPVSSLHAGEQPAAVTIPTLAFSAEFAREWLDVSGEADDLEPEWRFLPVACDQCSRGVIQARRKAGVTESRCTRCGPDPAALPVQVVACSDSHGEAAPPSALARVTNPSPRS